ncbi:MAG: hypothetical protein IKM28_09300 [Lachnospiraceae bacterium]|nr:hypothetical protein [Lachnospiraceae bacterium]
MYCKIYIHSESKERVLSCLEDEFGVYIQSLNDYYFEQFEIHLYKNKEENINRIHLYPDGFLYYELIADVEIRERHIEITNQILRCLWKNNLPSVAACDYEKELMEYGMK